MYNFKDEEIRLFWDHFKSLGREGLYASHYDLFEKTRYSTPDIWKEFLLLPEVVEYIRVEMEIIRKAAMNELFANAGDSNSVGKAQLLNAISKYDEDNSTKEGPIFIYTYVPLNSEQEKAPNVQKEKSDIFKKTTPQNPFNYPNH
jgi:hypothetical protein